MRIGIACMVTIALVTSWLLAGEGDSTSAPNDAALKRARKQVQMLDDLYKTSVVLITETYVKEETDIPAATAAIALFDAMAKKNWHEARLIDVTGSPYDEKNVAKDDFEKNAVKLLASGKQKYVEQVETVDGVQYLRAATPVPVVMKKCTMCHPHFQDAKPDQAIGAITYKLKIE